ncbi:MAG: hypothetical protein COA58_08805 [Bacteroidetes bacterium]|nr:MAG: hypothetical protein COA58_08805 [Bacteroidota bacterium]
MNSIEYLEWDSIFFNKKIGRLICDDSIGSPSDLDKKDFNLIYVFSRNKLNTNWQPYFLDQKTNSTLTYETSTPIQDNNLFEISEKKRAIELKKLISINGHYSRFYLDKNLNHKYEELYQIWGKKCFNFNTNRTWYYVKNNELVGFITIDISNNNQVELCSVLPQYRGQGIAKKLWLHAFNEIAMDGPTEFHISFQNENTIAKNLYKSLGFKSYQNWYIYHI